MVAGGLLGALGAYLFQVVGGRALGPVDFAPVSQLWTAFFILATVALVPLEQYVTRETSRGRAISEDLRVIVAVAALGVVGGVAYVTFNLDSPIFGGDPTYVVVIAALVLGYTAVFTAKGVLAGNRRFAAVGWLLMIEGALRLVAGLLVLAVLPVASLLAWAMVAAALAPLLLRFWRYDRSLGEVGRKSYPGNVFCEFGVEKG
jgi:O-antigen/teichoic acid export membrane protein